MTNDLLYEANFLANQGRLEEAIEVYRKVLEEDPENLDVRGYIIALSLKSGQWSEAIEQHMQCGAIFNQRGEFTAAVDRYREVLRLEETVESQGSSLRSTEDIARVKSATKRVKPEVCLQIGLYFLRGDECDQAIQYLRKSLELRPGCWQAHLALGEAYAEVWMDGEAIDQLQEVARLAPHEAAPAYELLGELFARGNIVRVRDPAEWFHLASDLYMKKQEPEAATEALLRGLKLDPNNRELIYALSNLYASHGRLAEAEEYRARADEGLVLSSLVSVDAPDALFPTEPEEASMKTRVAEFLKNTESYRVDWIKATLEDDGYLWTQGGYRLTYIQYVVRDPETPEQFLVGGLAEIGGTTKFIPRRERRRKPTQKELVLRQLGSWTNDTREAVLAELLKEA